MNEYLSLTSSVLLVPRRPGLRAGEDNVVEILLRVQESGLAVPTDTTLAGRHSLRVAIANHRTRRADLDLLIDEVLRLGRTLA